MEMAQENFMNKTTAYVFVYGVLHAPAMRRYCDDDDSS